MYCTINDLRSILPKQITIGDINIGTPSPGQPSNSNRSSMSEIEAIEFIKFAEQEVDSRLRPFYIVPLRRIKSFETNILNNIFAGSDVIVSVHDSGLFSRAQRVRLQSSESFEDVYIKSINGNDIVINQVNNDYIVSESKISILEFPDPIPIITARLAVSYAFDRLFSAEQSPNISEYGKAQRNLAINSIDNILTGTIFLFGQDHTGKRFVRGSVMDAYQNPTPDMQFGREKSQ